MQVNRSADDSHYSGAVCIAGAIVAGFSGEMKFHEKLKLLRGELNLSQQDIADAIENSQPTVSAWERGVHRPHSLKEAVSLARFLEVSLDYLFDDDLPAMNREELGRSREVARLVRRKGPVKAWELLACISEAEPNESPGAARLVRGQQRTAPGENRDESKKPNGKRKKV